MGLEHHEKVGLQLHSENSETLSQRSGGSPGGSLGTPEWAIQPLPDKGMVTMGLDSES